MANLGHPPQDSPPPPCYIFSVEERTFRRCLGILTALAVGMQCLLLTEAWQNNPFARLPIEDAEVYWTWAGRIADGHWVGETPFLSAPLYPYLLGFLRSLGLDLPGVYAFQAILHAGTLLMIGLLGRLRFGAKTGLSAAAVYLLLADPSFAPGRILNGTLQLFTLTAFLYGTVRFVCRQKSGPPPPRHAPLLLGFLFGLATLANPTLLLALPFLAWWMPRSTTAPWLIAALLTLAPATLHNYAACGEFIPISAQAGVTFFHGNASGAQGVYHAIEGVSTGRLQQNADAFRMAADATGQPGWGNTSSYFFQKGLQNLTQDPVGALELISKKLKWFFFGQNYGDVYLPKLEIKEALTRYPIPQIPLIFLLPLAFLGLFHLLRQDRRKALPEILFFLLPLLVVIVFWYSPRYRLPMAPLTALFAAWAASRAPIRRNLLPGITLGAMAAFLPPALGFDSPSLYQGQFQHSLGATYRVNQQPGKALPHLQEAIQRGYTPASAYYNLAQTHMALEDWENAAISLQKTVGRDPKHQEAWENLGILMAWQQKPKEAVSALQKAIALAQERKDLKSVQRIQQRLDALP